MTEKTPDDITSMLRDITSLTRVLHPNVNPPADVSIKIDPDCDVKYNRGDGSIDIRHEVCVSVLVKYADYQLLTRETHALNTMTALSDLRDSLIGDCENQRATIAKVLREE